MKNNFYTKVDNEVRTEENNINFGIINEENNYLDSIEEDTVEYIKIDSKRVDVIC